MLTVAKFNVFVLIFHHAVCIGIDYYWSVGPDESDEEKHYNFERLGACKSFWCEYIRRPASGENFEKCSEEESALTRKDLSDVIVHVKNHLNIRSDINEIFSTEAVRIRDELLKDFNDFIAKLEDSPNHVKHILKDIAERRRQLEPSINDVKSELQKYLTQEDRINVIGERVNATLQRLEKIKIMCQWNCENDNMKTTHRPNEKNVEFENFKDNNDVLRNRKVYEKLSDFKQHHTQIVLNRTSHDYDKYTQSIQKFKDTLKKIAITKFGKTMYEILTLQDDYYHFADFLKNNEISEELEIITKNILEIDQKLSELDKRVQEYKTHCFRCNDKLVVNKLSLTNYYFEDSVSYNPDYCEENCEEDSDKDVKQYNVLDHLIGKMIEEITYEIKQVYEEIYADLDRSLNDSEIKSRLEKLTPIQDKLEHEIRVEQQAYQELKNKVDDTLIDKTSQLLNKSKDLRDKLDSAIHFIGQFI